MPSKNKKNNTKVWSIEEKKDLYRLVQLEGTKWSDYAKIFHVTPNAVHNKFRYTDWDSFFDKNGIDPDDIINTPESQKDFTDEDFVDKENNIQDMISERKNKILILHEVRKQNEYLNIVATEEVIIDKITSSIKCLPPIDPAKITYPKGIKFSTTEQEAALVLSDLHVGLAVISEEVGGLSRYNTTMFKKRLDGLVNKVTRITEHHRKSSQIDKLNIFLLGDIVHGSNDAGQWGFLHTEINIIDQVFLAVSEILKSILILSKVFPKIEIHAVTGNHGRVGKKGVEKRFVNWDYIVYKFLEQSLSNQKQIKFNIPRAPFQVTEILGNKFLLMHGEVVKSWGGIPFYGLVRAENKYRSIFDKSKKIEKLWDEIKENKIDTNDTDALIKYVFNYVKSFQYFIIGHFHQMAEMESLSGGRLIINSSFDGGDDYSINTLVSSGTPAQKFFGIHKEGKSWSYDLELDRN